MLNDLTHTAASREPGVKTRTHAPIKGSQGTDHVSKAVSGLRDNHQLLPFNMGIQTAEAYRHELCQEVSISVTPQTLLEFLFCRLTVGGTL